MLGILKKFFGKSEDVNKEKEEADKIAEAKNPQKFYRGRNIKNRATK